MATTPDLNDQYKNDYFHSRFLEVCAVRPDAAISTVGGDNFQPLLDAPGVARAIERFVGELA